MFWLQKNVCLVFNFTRLNVLLQSFNGSKWGAVLKSSKRIFFVLGRHRRITFSDLVLLALRWLHFLTIKVSVSFDVVEFRLQS